jgi:large subunit ribosomal protein L23
MAGINKSPYRILKRPVITEKSANAGTVDSTVVFEVHPQATKTEIKNAVEKVFEVEVKSVRTVNTAGKLKRVAMRVGQQKGRRKAYVSLKPGHSINVIEGL